MFPPISIIGLSIKFHKRSPTSYVFVCTHGIKDFIMTILLFFKPNICVGEILDRIMNPANRTK